MSEMWIPIAFSTLWLTGFVLGDPIIACYFASWANYRTGDGNFQLSDIDPTLCTHMIYSFVGITEDGDVAVLDPWNDLPDDGGKAGFEKFVALRQLSPETKFMVAMGGWNEGSVKYSKVVADPSLRSNLVKGVVNFALQYKFDGLYLDWEYPNQRGGAKADVENFVLLLRELRVAFDEHNLILSAAVAAAESSASVSYNIPEISKSLDFINLMTYDYHGSQESTIGHNTPLFAAEREITPLERSLNIDATVDYWLNQGAPPAKLVLGIAFYGKSFTLRNSTENRPGSPSNGPGKAGKISQESGVLFYYEICERLKKESWTSVWDDEQQVPYAYKDDQWVSYDNVRSIQVKAGYIEARSLAGAAVWTVDEDDFKGICGDPRPLLNTINRVFRN